MTSRARSEPLDLEHGLPVTPDDVAALRRARTLTALTWDEYAAFLASLPTPSIEELRARPLLTGEPFRLVDWRTQGGKPTSHETTAPLSA